MSTLDQLRVRISNHFDSPEDASDFMRDCLELWADHTEATEPHAVSCISGLRSAADSMLELGDVLGVTT